MAQGKILVTGSAGFIGAALCKRLLDEGYSVVGLDNMNAYYDVSLKQARLDQFSADNNFSFEKLPLEDREGTERIFSENQFDTVINLAAQAGVRYSLENPKAYINTNLVGFGNILECCRHYSVKHLVYASSSSVYGANRIYPFKESQNVDHPISLYAASKKANELMAHTYSHLFGLPVTGLRFFTVYGPWGRPDMALFKFTRAILAGESIDVYNHGDMRRDFTYIDDIIEGVYRVMQKAPSGDPSWSGEAPAPDSSSAPYRIYNIGNNHAENLMSFIEVLEKSIGKKAVKNLMPMQPGDVKETSADIDAIKKENQIPRKGPVIVPPRMALKALRLRHWFTV